MNELQLAANRPRNAPYPIRIRLVMYLGEDGVTENVKIWEREPCGGPE